MMQVPARGARPATKLADLTATPPENQQERLHLTLRARKAAVGEIRPTRRPAAAVPASGGLCVSRLRCGTAPGT